MSPTYGPPPAVAQGTQAILLHVEEYGDEAPHSISFYKDRSRTVVVGRRSSAGAMASHADPTDPAEPHDASHPQRALFRCPVVSRKHAKITFTEYGNVRSVCFIRSAAVLGFGADLTRAGIHH